MSALHTNVSMSVCVCCSCCCCWHIFRTEEVCMVTRLPSCCSVCSPSVLSSVPALVPAAPRSTDQTTTLSRTQCKRCRRSFYASVERFSVRPFDLRFTAIDWRTGDFNQVVCWRLPLYAKVRPIWLWSCQVARSKELKNKKTEKTLENNAAATRLGRQLRACAKATVKSSIIMLDALILCICVCVCMCVLEIIKPQTIAHLN